MPDLSKNCIDGDKYRLMCSAWQRELIGIIDGGVNISANIGPNVSIKALKIARPWCRLYPYLLPLSVRRNPCSSNSTFLCLSKFPKVDLNVFLLTPNARLISSGLLLS